MICERSGSLEYEFPVIPGLRDSSNLGENRLRDPNCLFFVGEISIQYGVLYRIEIHSLIQK